ncbi:Sec-independent protein translocase subunit TatA [Dichelobacter nodosus]|uniref:Sec-independent protein translocase protein TatA n=1 Tax=Dichelobacter nodosus (strain VCS1703A) TaxID=246195 RepID=TATA_DICNV|nr:Sec-independent protein translocase subunit TatA [Dichelobacter nodosus]A5EVU2.1 RecName: Full=Sec-independent protein translocase protein TatA [Dichelobacter nodosus VCS1703A]ABQ13234.1 sec-independent protein translocase family protein TatA [Dichelobacter nodosus VCS1703A]AXM45336.1 Sec-independent protein translocase subunit TatA [Dichelobacter nodosus]KNZ40051.1 preprotein translocase subunit TatA [Dichelobacter nodosus]TGA65050.1 Sec-independent protein translocase subunit TatA [Dichel
MGASPVQLLIVLFIAVLVFGGKRLRTLGSDVGAAIKGFKEAMKEEPTEPEKLEQQPPVIEVVATQKEKTKG